jgi:hypothetical protein
MHESRCYLRVAVLDGLVYAIGGGCNNNTAERYDYRTNRWTMIAPMNEKRDSASAATLNGNIYIWLVDTVVGMRIQQRYTTQRSTNGLPFKV